MWFSAKPQLRGLCFMCHDPLNNIRTLRTGHTTLIRSCFLFCLSLSGDKGITDITAFQYHQSQLIWQQDALSVFYFECHVMFQMFNFPQNEFLLILIKRRKKKPFSSMHVLYFKPYLAKNYGQIFCWCTLKTCPETHVAWNHKKYCSKSRPQCQCKKNKHNLSCETRNEASHS